MAWVLSQAENMLQQLDKKAAETLTPNKVRQWKGFDQ